MNAPRVHTDADAHTVDLVWQLSPLTRAMATCAGLALAAAVIAAQWQLIAYAAPLLGVLVIAGRLSPPSAIRVECPSTPLRCFESETLELPISAEPLAGAAILHLSVLPLDGMQVEFDSASGQATHGVLRLTAQRWGRYRIPIQVSATIPANLFVGAATVWAGEVHVYPLADPQRTALPTTELRDRIGTHLTRHRGPGVEYADIRPYVPGDPLRIVNWPVSARRGRLHVTERLTDRAADVVVLLDTYPQPAGPATDATERTVRGATQVVQSALQVGDRAGIVCLGQRPRWLAPDIGQRQFYRVVDTALDIGEHHHTVTGTLAPHAALPRGAVIIAFSTLLDTQFALAAIDLSKRGYTVVVVDVLHDASFPDTPDEIVARLWRLERAAMYRNMAAIGVDIIGWKPDAPLDQAMQLLGRRSRRRIRR